MPPSASEQCTGSQASMPRTGEPNWPKAVPYQSHGVYAHYGGHTWKGLIAAQGQAGHGAAQAGELCWAFCSQSFLTQSLSIDTSTTNTIIFRIIKLFITAHEVSFFFSSSRNR